MKTKLIIVFTLACWANIQSGRAQLVEDPTPAPPPDFETEMLINRLPAVSEIGYGYSATFRGSQFLPDPDSSEIHMLVLGAQAPTNSMVMEQIVRRGVVAVPSLLRHLDDARETKIPPLSGMTWTSYPDEYDFNRRLTTSPSALNQKGDGVKHPSPHTITVGDLCFVALGQIVNRDFNAARYQPTGGLVVNSPTRSKLLCVVARSEFEYLNEARHRALLVRDFLKPDHEYRRIGACRRLAFYYPEELEPVVVRQLKVPTYDLFKVERFVRDELYPEKSPARRKAMFQQFLKSNGQASYDGIALQLFDDLGVQEADEHGRLSPPLDTKYDARNALIQLYELPKDVTTAGRPYVNTWSTTEEARLIEALRKYPSAKVDKAVYGVFRKVIDDDYLALACMNRLVGKGYDRELRKYCERRIRESGDYAKELQEILARLKP